ncbi:RING finger protein [Monoraphidium neglectum]|uniref:RING finger protein n=1 Tax=Monoraphidium neglectum TaxID=145388 RepID=A0A0D2MGA2_9CHLO|nr:RING finger protein [Monoraphidium neglectum]KIY94105.1 RING finger protein [Monoraphidium neglectum]|eukprot:XP_013893125.1 RING finger protein [Monoraphidium neglectum]
MNDLDGSRHAGKWNATPNWKADARLQQRLALLNSTGRHIINVTNVNGTTYADVEEEAVSPGFAILLMYLLLLLILGAQTGLVLWKKKHKRSYELVTTLGLWLMPAAFAFHLKFWRFLGVWAVFSAVTLHLLHLCAGKKKVDQRTPRKVRGAPARRRDAPWTAGGVAAGATARDGLGRAPSC